jgi:probable F420-dependent oxidoreductase
MINDLSAYVIAGAVSATSGGGEYESDSRTPAQGIEDGVDAERIGFARVFLSERWDIKEAGVILSGIAARTDRIEVGTGMICPTTRHPWQTAAFAATMQACYGPRFVLGLGRGDNAIFRDMGLKMSSYLELGDYVDIVRRLWRGETVSYDGPVGTFPALAFSETLPGPPPPIWFGTFARARGAAALASSFDGVMLPPLITPEATSRAVQRIREACERIDRDPSTIRISQAVITAPDLDEIETRSLAHGRAVGYLQYPGYGEILVEENGWDMDLVERMRAHKLLSTQDKIADRVYHRHELLGPAELLPDEWMADTCALGSVDDCVRSLQRFRDAGADEVATYGSTPRQNERLAGAWAARATATAGLA